MTMSAICTSLTTYALVQTVDLRPAPLVANDAELVLLPVSLYHHRCSHRQVLSGGWAAKRTIGRAVPAIGQMMIRGAILSGTKEKVRCFEVNTQRTPCVSISARQGLRCR